VTKLFVFLRRRDGLAPDEFHDAWAGHARASLEASELAARVRRWVQNRALPAAGVPELAFSDFDGVDELWFDDLAALERALAAPGYRPAPPGLADPGRAIVLAADESVQFDRGFGRVKFIGLSARAARFATRADWVRYWVEVHGPLAHGIPEFTRHYGRYVHNYVVPCEPCSGALEPAFDGIVEEWLESVEDFAHCLAEPEYLERVRPDELAFVDFSRSHMLVTREREVALPG
jgi:hypothetical protein